MSGFIITAALFLLVLGLLVLVHELGHFLVAKKFGVRVDEFGFGFPPRIVGKTFRGTLYSLNWIPLGGFVRIKGVAGDDSSAISRTDDDSFASKTFLRKYAILFAGIGMNLLLAVVLFAFTFAVGYDTASTDTGNGAILSNDRIIVSQIFAESPAAQAGIVPGDVIERYGDVQAPSIAGIKEYLAAHANDEVDLQLQRENGEDYTVHVIPQQITRDDETFVGIGVGLEELVHARYPIHQAVWLGFKTTGVMVGEIFVSLGDLVKKIFTHGNVTQNLTGPVGIAVLTRQVADLGFVYLLQFAAMLSVNLAVFNFLPIPALDGGRIVFVLIEKIQKKPVSQRVEATIHNIGFLLLLALIFLVTWKDITHL
jgi:regulator of sigma E protease